MGKKDVDIVSNLVFESCSFIPRRHKSYRAHCSSYAFVSGYIQFLISILKQSYKTPLILSGVQGYIDGTWPLIQTQFLPWLLRHLRDSYENLFAIVYRFPRNGLDPCASTLMKIPIFNPLIYYILVGGTFSPFQSSIRNQKSFGFFF